jgi:hypothetical protein
MTKQHETRGSAIMEDGLMRYTNLDDLSSPGSWRFTDFGRVRERSRDGSSTYRNHINDHREGGANVYLYVSMYTLTHTAFPVKFILLTKYSTQQAIWQQLFSLFLVLSCSL